MKSGNLFYNYEKQRIGITFEDGSVYGGLHCGECLEAFIDGRWQPTRIEYADDWYLVACFKPGCIPNGLKVRR